MFPRSPTRATRRSGASPMPTSTTVRWYPSSSKYGYDGPVYSTPPTVTWRQCSSSTTSMLSPKRTGRSLNSSNEVKSYLKHSITLNLRQCHGYRNLISSSRFTTQAYPRVCNRPFPCRGRALQHRISPATSITAKARLFNPAANQFPRLEATIHGEQYGGSGDFQPARADAEEKLYETISTVISREGKVIIPAFAVGRSQEVMLALEEGIRREKIPAVKTLPRRVIRKPRRSTPVSRVR